MAELWIYNKEQHWPWWWWWWRGDGDHSKIKLQKNRFKNILFKAGATDERDAVVCVWFEFPIRHILFRMALTTIETHLLYTHSTVPPLLSSSSIFQVCARKGSEVMLRLPYDILSGTNILSTARPPILHKRKAKCVYWDVIGLIICWPSKWVWAGRK